MVGAAGPSGEPVAFAAPRRLGVGLTYIPGAPAVEACLGAVDFLELSPDILCHEKLGGGARRLALQPGRLERALRDTEGVPVVVHGLGLSIGSARGWNDAYLELLDELCERRPFPWHSEHLGFLTVDAPGGGELNAGTPLPLPLTEEALGLIVPRGAALSRRYGVPFLLENLTWYLPGLPAEGGRDEIAFLNDFVERSGCGLLLDLYNLHCNAVNHGFDAAEALGRLRLDRVVQVHVAGGDAHGGFLMDVHSDVVPEPVWELLDWLVPRAPHLAGVSYELLEEARLEPETVRRQLDRARASWRRHPALAEGGARRGPA